MASSGSGTGTPITALGGSGTDLVPLAIPRSCLTLEDYARMTGYSECAIYGVNNPSEPAGDCENPIWMRFQRDTLRFYLAEAQQEIEEVAGYPLCPTYIADEEHPYLFPLRARWSKILEVGTQAEADIALNAAVNYATEPAVVTVASAVAASEVKVFYPGSDYEILPSSVVQSAGVLTVQIPRCRLVKAELWDTPQGGIAYEVDENFLDAVDLKRVYLDSSVNAKLVWSHFSPNGTCPNCGCLTCSEHEEDACLTIRNRATGSLDALQATYASAVWTPSCSWCWRARADKVRVNYVAGLNPINERAQNAVLRLAHAKMAVSPCGCDVLRSMWARDTNIPEVLTRERENNPFGMSDGAWIAYKFAKSMTTHRMSVI